MGRVFSVPLSFPDLIGDLALPGTLLFGVRTFLPLEDQGATVCPPRLHFIKQRGSFQGVLVDSLVSKLVGMLVFLAEGMGDSKGFKLFD